MSSKQFIRTLAILTVLCLNIGCDQISKDFARQKLDYHQEINLVNEYLTLTKVENTGAFLGLGSTLPQPLKVLLLTVIPLFVLGLAVIYLLTRKNLSNISMLGISFIAGGGIGNIYDRIVHGSVTDFLHIDFVIFKTGIFNFADVSIVAGMCMIVLDSYFNRKIVKYKHK